MSKILFFVVGAIDDPAAPLGIWATDGKDLDIQYLADAAEDEQHWLKALWPDDNLSDPPTLPSAIKLDLAGMEHMSRSLGRDRWATRVFGPKDYADGLFAFTNEAMADLVGLGRKMAFVSQGGGHPQCRLTSP